MTTSKYAEKIVKLIQKRPREVNPDQLLYEIYVKFKIAEGFRTVAEGRVYDHEQVREDMWKIIDSKSPGVSRRNGTLKKSSPKLQKTRR